MTRNLRNREHPAPHPVSSYTVAPDHYGPNEDIERAAQMANAATWAEFKELCPYKPGDVVWLEHYTANGKEARKAFISDVWPERDQDGFRRPKFRVHIATAKGDRFARNWFYTWPGYIERGYKLAAELTAEAK